MMKRLIAGGIAIATLTAANANSPLMKKITEDVIFGEQSTKNIIYSKTSLKDGIPTDKCVRMGAAGDTQKEGYVLYENFSGWNGVSKKWVPEGWSVEHNGKCSSRDSWQPLKPTPYIYPAIADGEYCFYINYSEEEQDEWLISPEFTPENNMELSYYITMNLVFLYSTKNLDWGHQTYEGDKITAYTIQVLIQEEGSDWKTLFDYAEEYKDYTFSEMIEASNVSALQKQTIDLSEYGGKTVKIAFRYLGVDGDAILLDAIGVGYPTLDNVWYMEPINSLYWGFSRNSEFWEMPVDIAFYPANTPITWQNMSDEDATFSWQYPEQNATGYATSDNRHELSVSYKAEEQGLTPLLYETPVLTAVAPERIDAIYRSPVPYFQIGGKPSYIEEGEQIDFTLFQFPINHLDAGFIDVRDSKQGAYSVPVFGYNEFSDNYWLNYSLNGEEPMEGNFSHLIGIGNVYFASEEAPLIVNGMSVYGWGRIWDDAELTATIYALDSEMHTDYDTFTVIARASITGKKVKALNDKGAKDYIYLPFHFDEPAIVQASEEHPAFLFMLEGFNSERVDYFAPLNSHLPNEIGYPAGYILHEINLQGHIENGTYKSLKSMQYMEDGEYYSHEGTFAIGLDAEYTSDNKTPGVVSSVDSEKRVEAIYDLNGQKVSNINAHGIYIIRYSDGTVNKVAK